MAARNAVILGPKFFIFIAFSFSLRAGEPVPRFVDRDPISVLRRRPEDHGSRLFARLVSGDLLFRWDQT
jgi:hypothetical protein